MINLQQYEYKAPSYEKRTRENTPHYSFDAEHEKSRFVLDKMIWRSKAGDKDEISMLFTGDLLCQENIISRMTKLDGRYDFTPCFEYLRPLFKAADFVAGNLETPVSENAPYRGEIITHEGPFYCNAPIEYLDALKYAGFDMLTTANNHTLDAGAEGLIDTIENCKMFDFIQTGTFTDKQEKFVVVDICGFKIGFTAFGTTYNQMETNLTREGRITLLNTYSVNRANSILEKMKARGAEYTICFPHWGREYTDVLSPGQLKMGGELTEMGYDCVIGSHSHVLQQFKYLNDKPVVFSLGNILSHINLTPKAAKSQFPTIMELKLSRTDGEIKADIKFIPCKILKRFKRIPFVVVPINHNLGLNRDNYKELKQTIRENKKMLLCDDELMNLEYPVSDSAAVDLEVFEQNLDAKLANYQSVEKKSADENTLETECSLRQRILRKIGKFSYTETRIGRYKVYKDYAELDCITTKATVVNIEKEVNEKCVTAVQNSKGGNDTARIVYLAKFVTELKKRAFFNFTQLESVRFYESVEIIGEEAFANCPKLTGLVLPKSLKSIDKRAFADSHNLFSVKIPSGVNQISDDAFAGCEKVTIYCEEGSYAEEYAKVNKINYKCMPL